MDIETNIRQSYLETLIAREAIRADDHRLRRSKEDYSHKAETCHECLIESASTDAMGSDR